MSLSRDEIWNDILQKRAKQDAEWGGTEHDREHSNEDWFQVIEKQISIGRSGKWPRERFINIAALCVAKLEAEL